MIHIPPRGRRFRWWIIGYGLAVFIWSAPEVNSVWLVTLLGFAGSVLLVLRAAWGRLDGQAIAPRTLPLLSSILGALMGLGGSLATVSLMLLKNARHAHIFPDYPTGLLLATLERAPAWALGGLLLGLGAALLWLALQDNPT
jgi:hypothetical protein